MLKPTSIAVLAAAILGGVIASSPAKAGSVADFYKGKDLTFLVGYSAGGSYGFYARLMAEHMSQYIPGKPNIIVQHMPGNRIPPARYGKTNKINWLLEIFYVLPYLAGGILLPDHVL